MQPLPPAQERPRMPGWKASARIDHSGHEPFRFRRRPPSRSSSRCRNGMSTRLSERAPKCTRSFGLWRRRGSTGPPSLQWSLCGHLCTHQLRTLGLSARSRVYTLWLLLSLCRWSAGSRVAPQDGAGLATDGRLRPGRASGVGRLWQRARVQLADACRLLVGKLLWCIPCEFYYQVEHPTSCCWWRCAFEKSLEAGRRGVQVRVGVPPARSRVRV